MHPLPARRPRSIEGFTLAELAIAMLIFSILMGGMFVTLSTQLESRRISDTQRTLEQAREAIIGFAIANGRLPCPATATSHNGNTATGSGSESLNLGNCTANTGYLPAITLGISPTDQQGFLLDTWGTRVHYAVADLNSQHTLTTTTTTNQLRAIGVQNLPSSPSSPYFYLRVCNTSTGMSPAPPNVNTNCWTTPPPPVTTLTNNALAILFSEGKNANTSGGTGADESRNLDGDPAYIYHNQTDSTDPNGEFDDLVIWLSPNILITRMAAANVL